MKFRFNAGAEFDMLTPEELKKETDQLKEELTKLRDGFAKAFERPSQRRFEHLSVNSTGAVIAKADIKIPGPNRGFEWNVRRIVVNPLDSSTVVAGATGAIFRILPDNPLYQVDVIPSIPWAETYGEGEFSLNSLEDLIVVVYNQPSAGNGSTIYVSGESREAKSGYYFGGSGRR